MTQATRYIHGHSWGTINRPNSPAGDLVINDETFEDMKAAFELLTSEGYYPPVLRAHQPDKDEKGAKEPRAIRDGFTYGRVADLVRSDSKRAAELRQDPDIKTPTKEGIWYGIKPADGVGELIDRGIIDQWSPSVYRGVNLPHPEMADKPLEAVPRHLAFVSKSYQKNLEGSDYYQNDLDEMGEPIEGNPHVQAFGESGDPFVVDRHPGVTEQDDFPFSFQSEDSMSDNNLNLEELQETLDSVANTMEANATAFDEMADAVEKRIDKIESRIDNITEELGENVDEGDKSPKVKRLEQRVEDLGDAVDEREARIEELEKQQAEDLAERAGLDLDGEDADEIVDLAADDPLAFAKKLVESQTPQSGGPRPTKGGAGDGPTTEEFADDEERKQFVVEEYGVTRGSEEFIDKYEQKFGESPYDF